jgi:hypothetical protein
LAEYKKGEISNASEDWLIAMEYGYEYSYSDLPKANFDSIIVLHPDVPQLLLVRAIEKYRFAISDYRPKKDSILNSALSDIQNAERLGLQDYHVHLWHAQLLSLLKQNEAALKEADLAVALSKENPECYNVRFQVRSNSGLITGNPTEDPDYLKMEKYGKTWKYKK